MNVAPLHLERNGEYGPSGEFRMTSLMPLISIPHEHHMAIFTRVVLYFACKLTTAICFVHKKNGHQVVLLEGTVF